jgi:hypothetical protein
LRLPIAPVGRLQRGFVRLHSGALGRTAFDESEERQRVDSTGSQDVGKQTYWQATLQRHLPLDSPPEIGLNVWNPAPA